MMKLVMGRGSKSEVNKIKERLKEVVGDGEGIGKGKVREIQKRGELGGMME